MLVRVPAAVFEAVRTRHSMESWRRTGDFRQRQRASEAAGQKRSYQQRQRIAAQTHQAIADFEVILKEEQERANREIDDLPPEAEAGFMNSSLKGFSTTYGTQQARDDSSMSDISHGYDRGLQRSSSDSQVRNLGPLDNDPCMKRPPSPCQMYDYGAISTKPRSIYAQHRQKLGEPTRPKYRHSSAGFYFPGPQFKQGPYGMSMLDPCLMAPRSWTTSKPPPVRWDNDAGDVRPLTMEDIGHRRNRAAGQVISDCVRTTNFHNRRAKLVHQIFDRNREDRFLEQVRFENGAYEGRWRDPLLDRQGQLPEEHPHEDHDWVSRDKQDMNPAQQLASDILFGLQSHLRTSRQRISQLFDAESTGPRGVLEPKEFLRGLQRLGIISEGITVDDIVDAMSIIDPGYDGRVNLPTVSRAVAAAQKFQTQRTQASQRLEQQHQAKIQTSYSESLPVEVVKVDRESRSLFNFERSFEKFRSQQRELLAQHNELPH